MLQKLKRLSSKSADLMGISASLLCMIHCLAIPVMISLGFIFGHDDHSHHDHDHHIHFHGHWMDFIFVALAIWAVLNASKTTHSKGIKIALYIAVTIFSVAVLLHESISWMIYVSLIASLSLVIVHIINWKFHRKCNVNVK
ncbi:MerC domain-containing protein [Belliella kenyensis]|uniref:MerC domain-containing protein n=1 Tax=Belliella kenyensis TaxID=1472724 RepID=A0ABV8EKJ2_9BACT|nr:MerC domain-containing protein [Belliella kenyensis]MCH7403456.1 MerC domain-containing protein [Belliella kenyensis]MDN3602356.1 MerC domain-containing protein [Belliella kenyensis]